MKRSSAPYLLAALLAVDLLFSCASAPAKSSSGKVPGWMNELGSDYPDAKYLAAVGEGDTRRDAESDATGALAKIFSVNVKVDTVAQQRYAELVSADKSYSESERSISQNVGTTSSGQFVNIRFSDPFVDKTGTTYIVAFLEREPTAAIYRDLVNKDLAKVQDFRNRADRMDGALERFALYDAAYQVSLNVERMIAQLKIIHSASAKMLEMKVQTPEVAEARDAEAAKLAYKLSIEGDTDGKIAGIARTILANLSLSSRENGALSVKGSWSLEPVTVNPQYKSVRWTINLSLLDEKGTAIATVFKESRENGLGDSEAKAMAYREVEKRLNKELPKAIQDYLTRVATAK